MTPCSLCHGSGRVLRPDTECPAIQVSEVCPQGCWEQVTRDYEERFRLSGCPWWEFFGLAPAGQSLVHPLKQDLDGGPLLTHDQT